jgi:uncharacterized protein (TIGR00369 family)
MPLRTYDENWPYLEQFSHAHAVDQQERLSHLPLLQNMGLRLEKVGKDYTKLSIAPPAELTGRKGVWQGGILTTLVDTAARQALRTTLRLDHDVVTVHLDTKYFLPVNNQRVFAEGSVVRKGRNLAHIDVAVVQEGGALVARGWCVLTLVRRAEPLANQNQLPAPAPPAPPTPPDCEGLEGGLGI